MNDDWQPIETAPKDQMIEVFGQWAGEISGQDSEEPDIYIVTGECERPDYPGFTWLVHGTDAYAAWVKATHWRALRPAPKEVGA